MLRALKRVLSHVTVAEVYRYIYQDLTFGKSSTVLDTPGIALGFVESRALPFVF